MDKHFFNEGKLPDGIIVEKIINRLSRGGTGVWIDARLISFLENVIALLAFGAELLSYI